MAADPSNNPDTKRYTYEWYVVGVCMVGYIFSFVDRQVVALMIDPIKHDLHLTETEFSLINGFAFSLFFAFVGLPIAYLADRFNRSRVIALGVTLWSLATAACGLSQTFVHMFVSRMVVGVGEAALTPAAHSMLADYFPREKLGRAVGTYAIGSFIGAGIAFLIGGYIIALLRGVPSVALPVIGAVHAWQVTFFIVGLPGLLLALLVVLTVRNPVRQGLATDSYGNVAKVSIPNVLRFIARHRKTFLCHFSGYTFYAMSLFCLMNWTPAFYMRHFGMTPVQAAYALGVIMLTTNTLGVLAGGTFTDWLLHIGYQDAPMRAGMIGALCMLVPAVAFTQVASRELSFALLVVAMFFASFPMPISTAAMQILSPNQMRAQVGAIFLVFNSLVGLGAGMVIVAVMTDKLFKSPLAVGNSMSIEICVASLLAASFLGLGCKHFRHSLASEEAKLRKSPDSADLDNAGGAAVPTAAH
jgi:predicted MFS family arabinose efflux permease